MGKRHILVVDDEPNVLMTYRLILEMQGYQATAAINSAEARTALNAGGVDLLLCDLSLEKQQNGFDVIGYGRSLDPELPCALLTGYASQDANLWAEKNRVPILFKPIDVKQLLDTIRSLLSARPTKKTMAS